MLPFARESLTPASRAFADLLLARWPEWRSYAANERSENSALDAGCAVRVEVASPTGDPERRLVVFMSEDEPSVGFGCWHTHEGVQTAERGLPRAEALLDLIDAILRDQFVLTRDVGGEHDGHWDVLDLRDPDALADELTSPWAPPTLRIVTWTGRGDCDRTVADLRGS